MKLFFDIPAGFKYSFGKYLENAVFVHLKRQGYSVYTGKIKGREIDFIAEKDRSKKYIQVAYLLRDEAVIEREFRNLEPINDNFETIVVSMDGISFGNRNGIAHVNALDFMAV